MRNANQQVRLSARPSGLPKDSDWELTEEPVLEIRGETTTGFWNFPLR